MFVLDDSTTCTTLNNPNNGVVNIQGNGIGSLAVYQCNSGSVLVGAPQRFCAHTGQWTGTAPTCTGKKVNVGLVGFLETQNNYNTEDKN